MGYYYGGSPLTIGGLIAGTTYDFTIEASGPGYVNGWYPSSENYASFNTACPLTQVTGYVYLPNTSPSTPVYGADIFDSGTLIAKTGADGSYQASFGCASHTYYLTARAMGFAEIGLKSGTINAGATASGVNIYLPYFTTSSPGWSFYQSKNYTYSFSNYDSSLWQHVTGFGATYVSSSVTGGAPDGAANIIEITGTDTSTSTSTEARATLDLGATTDPYATSEHPSLSAPLELSFNIFWADTGSYASADGLFGVDATLLQANGYSTTLDSVTDSSGLPILSSFVSNCYPADFIDYTEIVPNQWTTIDCDLTGLTDADIGDLLIVYDNGGVSTPGTLVAFIDGIQFIEPTFPTTITNGGFGAGSNPFGWTSLPGSEMKIVTTPAHIDSQSLRLGVTTPVGDAGGFDQVWQTFRVPNDIGSNSIQASLWYDASISSGGYVDAYIVDQATGQTTYVIPSGSGSTSGWTPATASITPLEGHIVTMVLQLSVSASSTSYAYFDEVRTLMQSITESETSSFSSLTNTFYLSIPRSVYNQACEFIELPSNAEVTASHQQTYYAGSTAEPVENNISLSADVLWYQYQCVSTHYVQVHLEVSYGANATGYPRGPSNSGFIGIYDTCLIETYTTNWGDIVAQPTAFSLLGTYNMGGSGPPSSLIGSPQALSAGGFGTFDPTMVIAAMKFVLNDWWGVVIEIITPLVILYSLEGLFSLMQNGSSGLSPACNNVTTPFLESGTWWDSNGFPAVNVGSTAGLTVNVGCTGSGCSGGQYAVNLDLIVDYCNLAASYNCGGSYFDTISDDLTIVITTS